LRVIGTAYSQYINSPAWREKREERLRVDGWQCTRCETSEHLQVHHVNYDRLGNEEIDDLLTLCEGCHAKEHGRDPEVPGLLPQAWFHEREIEAARLEWRQDVVAQAILAHKCLADLFRLLDPTDRAPDPRIDRVNEDLDGIVRRWMAGDPFAKREAA
jgi:hypothetical protein